MSQQRWIAYPGHSLMKDPDLRIGGWLNLDFKRDDDGVITVHMWEGGMGSLHSAIGLYTTLSLEDQGKLKNYLSSAPVVFDPDSEPEPAPLLLSNGDVELTDLFWV